MGIKYDFSGWATKNNVRCSDGRTIMQDAFRHQDGKVVPLVWQHQHDNPENVLGHAMLENRPEGVYAYCLFNDTEMGRIGKELVSHGDVNSLSIWANKLQGSNGNVTHGMIREVSLVLAGANPMALIDSVSLEHSDTGELMEMVECFEEPLYLAHGDEDDDTDKDNTTIPDQDDSKTADGSTKPDTEPDQEPDQEPDKDPVTEPDEVQHTDVQKETMDNKDKTVQDVIDSMTEEQKKVMYLMVLEALGHEDVKHSDEGDDEMKRNVFDGTAEQSNEVLSHSEIEQIIKEAKNGRTSLRDSFLAHADSFFAHADGEEVDYGIKDIDFLFPDYKAENNAPSLIKRDTGWVDDVMSTVHHVPFSRIKAVQMDITEDEARAKGYMKGNYKFEEVVKLLKRKTDPQTIYKKQKLDRDDIIDITSFDVVAFLKREMRIMLDEEIARAILIGDGRSALDEDKINEEHIRPVYTDAELYAIHRTVELTADMDNAAKIEYIMDEIVRARKGYKGRGNLAFYTSEDFITEMLLLKDSIGHRIYKDEKEVATALRVNRLVPVPQIEGLKRTVDGTELTLVGIAVNLGDYSLGADKGGAVSMFEDFDIDFNQEKYLIETRCSGALTVAKSAIVVETKTVSSVG